MVVNNSNNNMSILDGKVLNPFLIILNIALKSPSDLRFISFNIKPISRCLLAALGIFAAERIYSSYRARFFAAVMREMQLGGRPRSSAMC